MRAAVLDEFERAMSIADLVVAPLESHEVLVRTLAAGICHSDLSAAEGRLPIPTPIVLGHEASGVVAEVGRDVTSVGPGDHVVTCLSAFCGSCERCLSGRPNLCTAGMLLRRPSAPPRLTRGDEAVHQLGIGAFAEYMVVHENALVVIGDDIPFDLAAVVGCSVVTGLGAVFYTAQVRPGESVVVIGCGGVGLSCIQGAVIAGAAEVVAVDLQPAKLSLAERLGATATVDASNVDAIAAVNELTRGGADHVFEAVGSATTFAQATMMTRPRGTTTVVGLLLDPEGVRLPYGALSLERRVQGCTMGSNRFRLDIPRYLEMYRRGRLDLDSLVALRLTLDDVNLAFAHSASGESARAVLLFEE